MPPTRFSRFFRWAACWLAFLLLIPAPGVARAETVPWREPHLANGLLQELEAYYGPLAERVGPVGVVVELRDQPGTVIFAQGPKATAPSRGRKQLTFLKERQKKFIETLRSQGVKMKELYRAQRAYNGIWMQVEAGDVKKLASRPEVRAVHPIIPKELAHTTSVPLIGAVQAWAGSGLYQGDGITIGILDTGVDYRHAMFGGSAGSVFPTLKVAGGYDFVGDSYTGEPGTEAPDADPMDCWGHGTHVAGTAAGYGVLPGGSPYAESGADTYAALSSLSPTAYQQKFYLAPGVAPKATLYALRIFGCTGYTNFGAQAVEWAMDPNGDGDLSDHLDVINLSYASNFGSDDDPDVIAVNNAAQAGVIVVASAGNSGDVFYVLGAPSSAKYALSVASAGDAGAVSRAFDVVAAPSLAAGAYIAGYSGFGPKVYDVTANLAIPTPNNACSAIAEDLTGKIALVDRSGSCAYVTQAKNAQDRGALGVLIINNTAGNPLNMGGVDASIVIPTMMAAQATGNLLKSDVAGGAAATARLYSRSSWVLLNAANEDVIASSSSRGPARGDARLKPDLTAPGVTVFSAALGTSDHGVSMSGTSMASPHVAGVMALLRQAYPDWSVAELKALAMNTATGDVYSSTAKTTLSTPTRVGAGRVHVWNALNSPVIAYDANDPGQVSLSFGHLAVLGTQSFTKSVRVKNTSGAALSYSLGFSVRYSANPGLTFDILDAAGFPASSVSIPAGGETEIKLRANVDAAALTKALDPTLTTGARQRFSEGGGYLLLTSPGLPDLRLPVYIAPRPASAMGILENKLTLPAPANGSLELHPNGVAVASYGGVGSLAYALELMAESPNDSWSNGPVNAADLQYLGLGYDPGSNWLNFGLATHGKWDTPGPNVLLFEIYIDNNEDGVADYRLSNTGVTSISDTMSTRACNLATSSCVTGVSLNGYNGDTNTNIFDNNVLVLGISASQVGVSPANPDFNFYAQTFSLDYPDQVDSTALLSYHIDQRALTPQGGAPYPDDPSLSPTLVVDYDKTALAARGSLGLLVLHLSNAENAAETVPLEKTQVSITRAAPEQETSASSVVFDVLFTKPVSGVDTADFGLEAALTLSGATITEVASLPGGAGYTVTVAGYNGYGDLRLDVLPSATIEDLDGVPFFGGYTNGALYTIVDVAPPTLTAFTVNPLSASLEIPMASFSASDNVGVTGYQVTETATQPSAGAAGWLLAPPASYTVSADGSYTLYPWAKDASGNVSAAFVSPPTVMVDTTLPLITINNPGSAPAQSKTISASASEGVLTMSITASAICDASLVFIPYTSQTFTSEADNGQRVCYRAADALENTAYNLSDPLAGIDTTPPDTQLDSQPANPINSATASFTFSSADPAASFECSLDGGPFAACASPKVYLNLTDGSHAFAVRAKDLAGNTDATPTSFAWTIDTTGPNTSLTSQPAALTLLRAATFTFGSDEPGATFECALDGAAFAPCASPSTYTNLSFSRHTFAARALDALGNPDATPASYTWTVWRERLRNRGFNTYTSTTTPKIPDLWQAKNFAATDGKSANRKEGPAAIHLGGGSTAKSLWQTIHLGGQAGDVLNVSIWFKSRSLPAAGLCQMWVLLYDGAVLKQTRIIHCPRNAPAYVRRAAQFSAQANFTRIIVKFLFTKTGGDLWFDQASLLK